MADVIAPMPAEGLTPEAAAAARELCVTMREKDLLHRFMGGDYSCEQCETIAAALLAAEARGLEAAAQWHEDRAERVERYVDFLSDADREDLAKRVAADRSDAAEIRALAPAAPKAAPPADARDPETELDDAVRRVYAKYGTDLAAFMRDAQRALARSAPPAPAAPLAIPPIDHDYVPTPHPAVDACDKRVSDDGRNSRQCGRPRREHRTTEGGT